MQPGLQLALAQNEGLQLGNSSTSRRLTVGVVLWWAGQVKLEVL